MAKKQGKKLNKNIQKNLYDLEYNKKLNFQNVIFILIGTFIISFTLSDYSLSLKL